MRSKRVDEVGTARHRKTRDWGFSPVEMVGALAGLSVLAVAGVGAVIYQGSGNSSDPEALVETVTAQAPVQTDDPADLDAAAADEATEDNAPREGAGANRVADYVAKSAQPKAVCSAKKGAVTLKVDALVHALGAKGGTVRSEAAEAKIVARPASSNACSTSIPLFMGEDYAFEGKLPYGNWILDIKLDDATKKIDLTVDKARVAAPTQVLNGDCGGIESVVVRTRTEDAVLLGLTAPLPGTKVTAVRVPDGSCEVPAESSFTTGADGSFTGTIGYGDWMFSMTTPGGKVSEFVTVDRTTDEIVLTRTIKLLGVVDALTD